MLYSIIKKNRKQYIDCGFVILPTEG